MPGPSTVGVDATPLLGRRTGVGAYTAELVAALAARDDGPALHLVPFTLRGGGLTPTTPRTTVSGRRFPARVLRELWARGPLPPVEWLAGRRLDVFHGTNFLLPPSRAAGVVTVHDLTYLHRPEWVSADSRRYADLVPRGLRRAGAVCTVSAAVRAELLTAYPWLEPDRVLVTPNGLPPHLLAAEPGTAPSGDYVLALGTLEPRKGLDVLLAAWRLLRARRTDLPELRLAGGAGWGDQPAPEPGVVLTGYAPAEEVPALLAGAACLVFPSRYEGFGLPPLEALAMGTPVVASDLPVTREVLGSEAAYATAGDPEALAAALEQVLDAGRGTPADAARRRVHAASWTWAACAEATLRAYAVALG